MQPAPHDRLRREPPSTPAAARGLPSPLRIALTYAAAATAWSLGAIFVIAWTRAKGAWLESLAASGAIGFIVVTSVILHRMLLQHLAQVAASRAELMASERRLRTIFDCMADPLLITDLDGNVSEANPGACTTLGYSRDQFLAMRALQIDATMGEEEGQELVRRLLAAPDETITFRAIHRRADRTTFPVEVRGRMIDWEGRPHLLAISRDQTHRESAEAALRASERRLRSILDSLGDPLYLIDDSGCLVDVNPRACEALGRGREELIGLGVMSIDGSQDRHGFDEVLHSLRARPGEGITFESLHRRADGSTFPVEIRAVAVDWGGQERYLATTRDLTDRRRVEEALRASEELLRLAQEAANAGSWSWNLRTGRFVWSDSCWRLLGAEPGSGEPSYDSWLATVHEDDRAGVEAAVRQAAATGADLNLEWRVRGDVPRWLMSRGRPAQDAEGRPGVFLGVVIDITPLKQTEQALRESEERFRTFMDNSPTIAWAKDERGRYVYLSATYERRFGVRLGDWYGKTDLELFPDKLAAGFRRYDLQVLSSGRGLDVIEQMTDPGGVISSLWKFKFPFRDAAGNRYVGGVAVDVTERLRAEEAVRELNAELERRVAERTADVRKLAGIIDASTDFVATARPDGTTIWANRAMRETVNGHGPHEWGGRIAEAHPPDSARLVLEQGLPSAARNGHWLGETEVIANDGRIIPVSQLILAHRGADGEVAYFSTIMRDISERKRLEETLRERSDALALLNADLARASRLKDEFLASMSHELRTPLTAVLGLSEAMREGVYGPISAQQAEATVDIERSGRHLLELINDILDLAKVEAGELSLNVAPISVDALCQASLRMVRPAAQSRCLTLTSSIGPGVDRVIADERRLKQILVNLLSNAVKFTPVGGSVGLEVREEPATGTLAFLVWDTGIGIKGEDRCILFQPFRQIDSRLSREYPGTGLGLALVQRLATLHGGTVSVESMPGRGSRFTVRIPWKPIDDGLEAAAAAEWRPGPGDGPRPDAPPAVREDAPRAPSNDEAPLLLLAEDDDAGAWVICDVLEAVGYRVARARDGDEAIRMARELAPRVVLMDIQMPGTDGLTAIRILRGSRETRKLRIIALTALAMAGDRERCLAAGADAYLSKPVELAELRGCVAEMLLTDAS